MGCDARDLFNHSLRTLARSHVYSMGRNRTHLFCFSGKILKPDFLSLLFNQFVVTFQDRTVKVWRSEDGILCRTLGGHAHWVNTLALSTDYVLRTGAFEPAEFGQSQKQLTTEEAQKKAQERYDRVCQLGRERLVSGSDDFTLFLWYPETDKKCVGKLYNNQSI